MSDSITEYRDVPDYPGYQVGSDGSVWTSKRKGSGRRKEHRGDEWARMSTPRHRDSDYYVITLCHKGKSKKFLLHRLVLLTFEGPPPSARLNCLHRDDDKENNTPGNLYWGNQIQNGQDAIRNGRTSKGIKDSHAKLTEDQVREIKRLRAEEGIGCRKLARMFGLAPSGIQYILSGVNWSHVKLDAENKFTQGDTIRGNRNPAAKLTEDQVKSIKKFHSWGNSQSRIARIFGVHQTVISAIIRGKLWSHVT